MDASRGARKKIWNNQCNRTRIKSKTDQHGLAKNQKKNSKSKIRKYPIGKVELEALLVKESHIIPVVLLNNNSGYHLLLDNLNIKTYTLCLVIQNIHKSLDTRVFADEIKDLLLLTFTNAKFTQNLSQFISHTKYQVEVIIEYLPLICEIIGKFLELSPVNAFPIASGFVDTCMGIIHLIKSKDNTVVDKVKQSIQLLQIKLTVNRESYVLFKNKLRNAPPNNFRDLEVVPTSAELNAVARPFIRPNIIDGSYDDVDHYLDIQFRLLKEDFMRPLREGLNQYRTTGYSKHSDVRVYSNFTLRSTGIKNTDFIHYFFINTKKNFSFKSSKRFMYGNIICISNDNFDTVMIASVYDTDRLSENLLGIKIETESAFINNSERFVAIESKACFEAYKHTLIALQEVDKIPFDNYIVFVNELDKIPEYSRGYEMNDITNNDLNDRTHLGRSFNQFYHDITNNDLNDRPHLGRSFNQFYHSSQDSLDSTGTIDESDINISASNLNMDESQLRALNAALNRQVAIIQGPPGTGKTFIGLEITKILIDKKSMWSKNESHPILVVCYTNHALDQFLEGMINFTRNIIRVGSRSKNEALKIYDIKNCLYNKRGCNNEIISRYHDIKAEINCCARFLGKISENINILDNFNIVDVSSFTNKFAIFPIDLVNKLEKLNMKLFLKEKLNSHASDFSVASEMSIIKNQDSENFLSKQNEKRMKVKNNNNEIDFVDYEVQSNNDFILSAEEELVKREENERMLDDQDAEMEQKIDNNKDMVDAQEDEEEIKVNEYMRCDYYKEFFVPCLNILSDRSWLIQDLDALYINDKNLTFPKIKKLEKAITIELELLEKIYSVEINENECILLENSCNINKLGFIERAKLYCYWKNKLRNEYEKLKQKLEKTILNLNKKLQTNRQILYLDHMKRADIVGMTTTGAARYYNLLYDLAPPIVIVEEAAEILEAHVVSSLSSKCQHLILIGDHKQLRPKPAVYELAKKYNLDKSLFERLISNGIKYETLEYQHRMKPIISDLLVPTIYENLKDHPSVFEYPKIRGLEKDLFFINHSHHESKPSNDNESFKNVHEARFVLGLCRHLVYQGYTEKDITILTPYSGQFRCLRQFQNNEDMIKNIPINILDNFQGEESNIILLSLVRSNEEENVGFMKIDNRICVAISRAKHGMYIIGNMNQMIKSSSIWSKINEKLVSNNSIGFYLHLSCKNHPELSITVNSYEEFALESPEGGCKQKCSTVFPKCGHACPRFCHPDDLDHTIANCEVPCPKFLCEFNHTPCKNLCYEDCPKCVVPVEKKFTCGHKNIIKCFINPDDTKCTTIMDKILPCNHLAKNVSCSDLSEYICRKQCLKVLGCGHNCKKRCHKPKIRNESSCIMADLLSLYGVLFNKIETCPLDCQEVVERELDCGHKHNVICCQNINEFKCPSKVDKRLSCGHEINVECHIDVTTYICRETCSENLMCGHVCDKLCHRITEPDHKMITCTQKCLKYSPSCNLHKCKNLCNENCESCTEVINWRLKCGHVMKGLCSSTVDQLKCLDVCQLTLSCGHPCPRKCIETCGGCKIPISKVKQKCGHTVNNVPCDITDEELKCREPCKEILECNHPCPKLCGEDCGGCRVPIIKVNPKCGHIDDVPCNITVEELKCLELCNKILPCNHRCSKLCGDSCGGCVVPVKKVIPECSHRALVPCEEMPSIRMCSNPCLKLLTCGHPCKNRCKDQCTQQCMIKVALEHTCPRGHATNIPCYNLQMNRLPTLSGSLLDDYSSDRCTEICGLPLDCNHNCKGKCGECLSGRLHVPCSDICRRTLPCGHKCKAACSVECPPCKGEKCLWKCSHMNCNQLCGDPCSTICKKKCPSSCAHSVCESNCGNKCSRKPCVFSCVLKISKCDHRCIGFCGEPCPSLCKICDKEKVEELIVGNITLQKAKFIMLEDCNHVFEATFLDKWMQTKSSKGNSYQSVKMKICPECKVPIYNTRRYRSLIMNMFKEITTTKTTRKRLMNQEWFRQELIGLKNIWPVEASLIRENLGCLDDSSIIVKKKYIASSVLDMCNFQINFLKFASSMKDKITYKLELELLIKLAMSYEGRMTVEKREDFFCEIRRLKSCHKLSTMTNHNFYNLNEEVVEISQNIKDLMDPTVIFNKEIVNKVNELFDKGWNIINQYRVGGSRGRGGFRNSGNRTRIRSHQSFRARYM